MSSCVCKISFKSVQVCGGCCKMFRGLTFLGHNVVDFFCNDLYMIHFVKELFESIRGKVHCCLFVSCLIQYPRKLNYFILKWFNHPAWKHADLNTYEHHS